jgi:hypothetical protein
MEILAGGRRKGKIVPPSKNKKRRAEDQVVDTDLPTKIEVHAKGSIMNVVPGHVWRTKAFKWNPLTFATEAEQLNSKFIEPSKQDKSLSMFIKNPETPMIYGVSGNPDDSKAKYFAAYLIDLHMKHLKADANPVWATLYGGFDNPYLSNDKASPTILVISNLTPNSTTTKLEKARDLIEAFPDIPRIVLCAGMDPLSFLTTRLHVPVHGLAYFSEALIKARVEII